MEINDPEPGHSFSTVAAAITRSYHHGMAVFLFAEKHMHMGDMSFLRRQLPIVSPKNSGGCRPCPFCGRLLTVTRREWLRVFSVCRPAADLLA